MRAAHGATVALTSRATRQRRFALATASDVAELLATHPEPSGVDREILARCIAECFDCARSCTACADADLAEKCERHAQHHEHCRICADTCRRCEEACASLLEAIG